jgi:hypothetical protein
MSVEIEQPTITIKCKYCQSEAILRYGTYKGVQQGRLS